MTKQQKHKIITSQNDKLINGFEQIKYKYQSWTKKNSGNQFRI